MKSMQAPGIDLTTTNKTRTSYGLYLEGKMCWIQGEKLKPFFRVRSPHHFNVLFYFEIANSWPHIVFPNHIDSVIFKLPEPERFFESQGEKERMGMVA